MSTHTTSDKRNRDPKGIPTGGQFAAERRGEVGDGVDLTSSPTSLLDHPMFAEVRDRLEMDMSADPVYSGRTPELLDRLDQLHLSDDSSKALRHALDTLEKDPEDEDAAYELGKALLRDANRESNDPTERQFVSSLEREDAEYERQRDVAREAVAMMPEGYRERGGEVIENGDLTPGTLAVIDEGPRSREGKQDFHRRIASGLVRDTVLASIPEDEREAFTDEVLAMDRPAGVTKDDVLAAIGDMPIGTASTLKRSTNDPDERMRSSLRRSALYSMRSGVTYSANDRITKEVASEYADLVMAQDFGADEYDLREFAHHDVNARSDLDAVVRSRLHENEPSTDTLKDLAKLSAKRARTVSDSRRAFARGELSEQMERDIETGRRSLRRTEQARQTITSGNFSDDTRMALDIADGVLPSPEDRSRAVDALARDAVVRDLKADGVDEFSRRGGGDITSVSHETAVALSRGDIDEAVRRDARTIRFGRNI